MPLQVISDAMMRARHDGRNAREPLPQRRATAGPPAPLTAGYHFGREAAGALIAWALLPMLCAERHAARANIRLHAISPPHTSLMTAGGFDLLLY